MRICYLLIFVWGCSSQSNYSRVEDKSRMYELDSLLRTELNNPTVEIGEAFKVDHKYLVNNTSYDTCINILKEDLSNLYKLVKKSTHPGKGIIARPKGFAVKQLKDTLDKYNRKEYPFEKGFFDLMSITSYAADLYAEIGSKDYEESAREIETRVLQDVGIPARYLREFGFLDDTRSLYMSDQTHEQYFVVGYKNGEEKIDKFVLVRFDYFEGLSIGYSIQRDVTEFMK